MKKLTSKEKCLFRSGKSFGMKKKYFTDDAERRERKQRELRKIATAAKRATALLAPDEDQA